MSIAVFQTDATLALGVARRAVADALERDEPHALESLVSRAETLRDSF